MVIAPQSLRRRVNRDGSVILQASLIDAPVRVPDQQVALYLEVGNSARKVLFALLAEAG